MSLFDVVSALEHPEGQSSATSLFDRQRDPKKEEAIDQVLLIFADIHRM